MSYSGAGSFSAQVDKIVLEKKELVDLVIRESVQRVIDLAQLSTEKGGNMRVDTGFLRASGQLSLSGVPSGPARGELKEKNAYKPKETQIEATLAGAVAGNTLYFAWSASYARPRNYHDGFLDLAVQKWSTIVDGVVRELKK